MRNIHVSFILIAIATNIALAQDRIPVDLSTVQFNVNILEPGLTLETALSPNQSFVIGAAIASDFTESDASINPVFRGAFRHYYPRKYVRKELRLNSGNYIGLTGGYVLHPLVSTDGSRGKETADSWFVGAMWGIQRNYLSGIHLGLSLGGGFGDGPNMGLQTVGVGQLELGFVIR
jgi:hypothetical protein